MPPGLPSATDAYNQLQSFNSSRPAATSYTDQANQQYGVGDANKQVSGLQSSLGNLQNAAAAVAPSVTGRTTGTFTTAGQRSALINKEQAPIYSNINDQNQALGQAQTAQGQAQQMASQMAQGLMSQDQTKYQSLLDQYNAANAASQFQAQQQAAAAQAAEQARQFNASLAEQIRQFNLTPRGGSGGGGINLGGIGSAATAAKAAPAMQQRTGGGFNFQDAGGKAISAATYAQQTNTPLGTLLKQMAQAGDAGAANAYAAIANHPGLTDKAMANIKKNYSGIFWGA